jgi:hypothetical protein
MKIKNWIEIFASFKELFEQLGNNSIENSKNNRFTNDEINQINELILNQKNFNGWFTEESVRKALYELSIMLNKTELIKWLSDYSYAENPKNILIIMAGNLPLVGFHDLLCVWLSGNHATIKLSSDDKTLFPKILDTISKVHPEIISSYKFSNGPIKNIDAVIATGSDNANLYFEKYFGHIPCLLRNNRTSLAILDGTETEDELLLLGNDLFDYFGKGCRNVSFLFIPENYDLNNLFEAIVPYGEIINNKKYGNNYDYNRAIHLMNQAPILDNNFVLLKESNDLFSPIAMIHYHRYSESSIINDFISIHQEDIQIIIGHDYTPFGNSQKPKLAEYADQKDTMKWLNQLP